MRYTCLVAILIALPVTADAQQRVAAGRGRSAQTPSRSEQAQAERRADGRRADDRRGGERQHDQRQHDQRENAQRQSNQRQAGPPQTGFIGPIGLPPLPSAQPMPWWEQRQIPAWEKKQTPWWEQQQTTVNPWQTMNPARALLDQERDARRLAKNPRPVHPIYRPGFGRPPIYYPLPPYGYYFPFTTYGYGASTVTTEQVAPPPPEPETGFLRLEVEPRHLLQVFVDGLYLGTIDDLGDDIELRLGPRRIELRAPGYRTLIFDTRIEFDRMVVYRGALDPVEQAPEAPSTRAFETPQAPQAPEAPKAPQGSRTMYLIPGCYMGNVQPTAAMLPPGCDISKLVTMTP